MAGVTFEGDDFHRELHSSLRVAHFLHTLNVMLAEDIDDCARTYLEFVVLASDAVHDLVQYGDFGVDVDFVFDAHGEHIGIAIVFLH